MIFINLEDVLNRKVSVYNRYFSYTEPLYAISLKNREK